MIKKEIFEQFMEEQEITYAIMYYIKDDTILDSEIECVSQLLFNEPKEFKEIKVFWSPKGEKHHEELDYLLEEYEEEWFDFCGDRNLNMEDEIEFYDIRTDNTRYME